MQVNFRPKRIDKGGRTAAVLSTLIASCKRLRIEPFAYLRDLFTRISSHPHHRLDELLPDKLVSSRSRMPETLRRNVEESLQFPSGRRLKAGYIAAEFIRVENLPHCCLKARELGGKIRILICRLREVQQLLTHQVVQRVLDAETLASRGCCFRVCHPPPVWKAGN